MVWESWTQRFPEPEAADWVDDWSPQESTPIVGDVTVEQCQTLASMSPDDVMSADCVQLAEALAVEANRTLAQARTAVSAAKQNRSGFFPPSNALASRKGKGKLEGKTEDATCLICG